MSIEYLEIPECPKCKTGHHRCKLEVTRSLVLGLVRPGDLNKPSRKVRFTRLFTCPVTNEDFQATFVLTDTSSDRITDVKVLGTEIDE